MGDIFVFIIIFMQSDVLSKIESASTDIDEVTRISLSLEEWNYDRQNSLALTLIFFSTMFFTRYGLCYSGKQVAMTNSEYLSMFERRVKN